MLPVLKAKNPRSNLKKKKKLLSRKNYIGTILIKKKRMLQSLMKGPKKPMKSRRRSKLRKLRKKKTFQSKISYNPLDKNRRNPILQCPSSTPSRSM